MIPEKYTKKGKPRNKIFRSGIVARLVGCSERQVQAVRKGDRSGNTNLGKRIQMADTLLETKGCALLQEVQELLSTQNPIPHESNQQ
jgi:hypothetical protein